MKRFFWGLLFCVFLGTSAVFAKDTASKALVSGQELFTQKPRSLTLDNQKALILIFLSVRCPNSQAHAEHLKKLIKDFADFKFVVVHSNADEPLAEAKSYFQSQHFDATLLSDPEQILANKYEAFKTPHVFVLSPSGTILYRGGVTDSADVKTAKALYLQEALEDIRQGRKVRRPEGRTLGCIIQRTRGTHNGW